MKNLLIITPEVDDNAVFLGFFTSWIREFAKRFNKVFVITLTQGKYSLPPNVEVYSLGKEKGRPRLSKAFKYCYLLCRFIPRSHAIFAHTAPLFAISAWPLSFILRKKIYLWYLHRSVTTKLKLAYLLSRKVITAREESLGIKGRKVVAVGHAIDANEFREQQPRKLDLNHLKIVSVGRITAIKNYETLIEAADILRKNNVSFEISLIGAPVMSYDYRYKQKLEDMISDLGLEDVVRFKSFVPYSELKKHLWQSNISVNATPKGGIDKAVLESMAAGTLPLTSNSVFEAYFGPYKEDLIFEYGQPQSLVSKIIKLREKSQEEIDEIRRYLIENVSNNHSLEKVISNISTIISQ